MSRQGVIKTCPTHFVSQRTGLGSCRGGVSNTGAGGLQWPDSIPVQSDGFSIFEWIIFHVFHINKLFQTEASQKQTE